MKEVVGIDLGGTNFKVGLVRDGLVVKQLHHLIQSKQSEETLLQDLYQLIDQVKTNHTEAIGIGVPGIVDADSGIIYDIQNIPSWKEVALKRLLEARYGVPVALNNDANCFALGEKMYGEGRTFRDFVGLSIGTGIGMGIIINHKLYSGMLCGAGEIGMVPYKDGIIENYASSFFFSEGYEKTAKEMSELALRGESKAVEAYKEFGVHLGEAIKIIMYLYAPQAIVLGGSISKAYPLFRKSMERSIGSFAYPMQRKKMEIRVTTTANLPILGAAALCF